MKMLKKSYFIFFLLFLHMEIFLPKTLCYFLRFYVEKSDEDGDSDKKVVRFKEFILMMTERNVYNLVKPVLDGVRDTFQYVHEYNLSTGFDMSTRYLQVITMKDVINTK